MKLILSSLIAVFVLSSCNTMVGVGQDTRLLGQGLEDTARKSAPGGGTDSGTSGAPVY
jgi:predicted small secreted protein